MTEPNQSRGEWFVNLLNTGYGFASLAQVFQNLEARESYVTEVSRYVVLHVAKFNGEISKLNPENNARGERYYYAKYMEKKDREVMIDILRNFEKELRENPEDARILDKHEARILALPETRKLQKRSNIIRYYPDDTE